MLTIKDIKKAVRQIKKNVPKANAYEAWIWMPPMGRTKHYDPASTDQIERQIMEDLKNGETQETTQDGKSSVHQAKSEGRV